MAINALLNPDNLSVVFELKFPLQVVATFTIPHPQNSGLPSGTESIAGINWEIILCAEQYLLHRKNALYLYDWPLS